MKKLLSICLLAAIGCSEKSTPAQGPTLADFKKLERRLSALETNTKKTNVLDFSAEAVPVPMASQAEVNDLENRVAALEVTNILQSPAVWLTLDMTSHAYTRIDTYPLPLLVSPQNAETYLDGYRVTIQVGNPHSATLSGLTIHTLINTVPLQMAGGKAKNWAEYVGSSQRHDFEQTEFLYPGRWNSIVFELVPCTAEALRTLRISIDLKTLTLK